MWKSMRSWWRRGRGNTRRCPIPFQRLMKYFFPLILLVASAASAQDWTRFRGPNGAGQSSASFQAQWADKDIVWKVELPAGGHGSVVNWGKKLFLTGGNDQSGAENIMCVYAE